MRGFLSPALRTIPSEAQARFSSLSRNRRTKLAKTAQTTLLKADQWARGAHIESEVAEALGRALTTLKPKK